MFQKSALITLAFFAANQSRLEAQTSRCDSTRSAASTDSVSGMVSLYVEADAVTIADSARRLLGREIAGGFQRPTIDYYPVFRLGAPDDGPHATGYFGVTGEFRAVWHADGRLTNPQVTATTLIPAFDSAVVRALLPLNAASPFRPMNPWSAADSLVLRIRIDANAVPPASILLYDERFARRSVTQPLRDFQGGSSHYVHIMDSRTSGATGFLTVWFVVDDRGRALPQTLQILHTDHPRMIRASRSFRLSHRYVPTKIDGCPVPTLVIRRIDFRNVSPPAGLARR